MTHRETTLRHLWLAGLGAYARVRTVMDRLAGRTRVEPEEETPAFVTTQKPAKRVSSHSSGGRRAGERDAQRRIAGKGR
jgi:hypothetical protein